jgi:hypothetical protein
VPALCSFFGCLTIASCLGGSLPESPNPVKAKNPDQTKLQGYMERYQKALEASWLVRSRYELSAKSSGFNSKDESVGQVIFLRLPGLPELFFWETEKKGKPRDSFFKLHIGPCRLCCYHQERGKSSLSLDCCTTDCHLFYIRRFRVDDDLHVWFRGSVGGYEWIFEKGDLHHYRQPSGFFDNFAKKVYKSVQSQGPFGLLFNARLNQLQKRFDFKLTKEDDDYIYIEVFPRNADDRADFVRAQVVIDRATFLPVRLWYAEPNHDTMTFNFTGVLTTP